MAYGWGPGIEGNFGLRNTNSDVDVSFSDILEDLQMGAMGQGEARKGKWSILVDGLYMKLEDKQTLLRGRGRASVEFEQTMIEGFVGYRVIDDQVSGEGGAQPLSIDLMAGGRWNHVEGKLGAEVVLLGLGTGFQRRKSVDWLDPVIGARVRLGLTDQFSLAGWADVGGFGVGADSTWQLAGWVDYDFQNSWHMVGGYRHLNVDYEEGSGSTRFALDADYSGPFVGVRYRF